MKKRRIVTAFGENSVLTDDKKIRNKITARIIAGKNRMNIVTRKWKDKITETALREQITALYSTRLHLRGLEDCSHHNKPISLSFNNHRLQETN